MKDGWKGDDQGIYHRKYAWESMRRRGDEVCMHRDLAGPGRMWGMVCTRELWEGEGEMKRLRSIGERMREKERGK